MQMQPQALVQSNLALVNLMEPLSQKFSTDASSRFADWGERNGRFYAQLTVENAISGEKKVRRVPQ